MVRAASSSEPPMNVGLACRPVGAYRRHLVKRDHYTDTSTVSICGSCEGRYMPNWYSSGPGGNRCRKAAAASLERSFRREWLVRIQDEHDQPMQFVPAAVGDLHRMLGGTPRQRLAGFDNVHAVRGLLAQLTLQHVERLGAGMRVHPGLGAWRRDGMVDAQQVLGGGDVHQGADLGDHAATMRRRPLGTKRKEPGLALHVGGQGQRTSRRLGVRQRGEILDVPIQRAGRQLGDCLLRHRFYDKLLLLLLLLL